MTNARLVRAFVVELRSALEVVTNSDRAKQNARAIGVARAVHWDISLTMSYFHTGTRTIIGAEAFHFPVRDGKEWDHLAMVIRLNWLPARSHERAGQIMEFESVL